jgi:hypothetical protein
MEELLYYRNDNKQNDNQARRDEACPQNDTNACVGNFCKDVASDAKLLFDSFAVTAIVNASLEGRRCECD